MSGTFPIQNSLKQGDALSPLICNFALERSKKTQMELKLNGTHQLLVCAEDGNLLREHINTIKKITALTDASKEVCLYLNTEKTRFMLMSHH